MSARLLVAGVGNIFLADDAFGPEVVRALERRPLPPEVRVRDFGIRGMDLAYALLDGHDAVVLVDAAVRGHEPGTLSLIEPELPDRASGGAPPEAHGMDPAKVLALAAHLGEEPLPRVLVLACEPELRAPADEDIAPGVSATVREAVGRAVEALHTIVPVLLADPAATPPLSRPDESDALSSAGLPGTVSGGAEDR
ncbi:hydrogenase expression/formation protein [Streptomyces viridochromogenes DSM 40736]|uniref:Hydrogenase expression/formation protein n=1 Tax=Streptomyces viridochromogenes (strain DSM 40736 / JCM 4977 / BCRC 1201 / Tue 494) TaxID=591159 RepID=D9X959_STRVT|nr:hydrogenase maturation protease [Streptomyces viridochromogenes]EFL30054.1 hydrogenase expression/formation protein [Streptomyces viridochromogenes DSM 40736]